MRAKRDDKSWSIIIFIIDLYFILIAFIVEINNSTVVSFLSLGSISRLIRLSVEHTFIPFCRTVENRQHYLPGHSSEVMHKRCVNCILHIDNTASSFLIIAV
jgi:hypothetical protein